MASGERPVWGDGATEAADLDDETPICSPTPSSSPCAGTSKSSSAAPCTGISTAAMTRWS